MLPGSTVGYPTDRWASCLLCVHRSVADRPILCVLSESWLWPVVEFNFHVLSESQSQFWPALCQRLHTDRRAISQASDRPTAASTGPTSDVRVFPI